MTCFYKTKRGPFVFVRVDQLEMVPYGRPKNPAAEEKGRLLAEHALSKVQNAWAKGHAEEGIEDMLVNFFSLKDEYAEDVEKGIASRFSAVLRRGQGLGDYPSAMPLKEGGA